MEEIINYENFVKKTGIKKSDKILINSNFLKIMINAKKKNKNFDLIKFIDAFLKFIGSSGTLLIPAYSWEFIKNKKFSFVNSKAISGSLANKIINHTKFKRTKNPIYSFFVAGKDQKYLCSMKHKDSFSLNSPFGYLIKNNGKNLFIDIDYKDSFTFVHLAEQNVGVNYRFKKKFTGYIFENTSKKKETIYMYSRKLNLGVKGTKIDKKLDSILKKNNSLSSRKIYGISCQIVSIKKAYNLMVKSLRDKKKFIYPSF